MTAQNVIDELEKLYTAARICGLSCEVTAHIGAAAVLSQAEKRRMDCPHTETQTYQFTHPGGRDKITSCIHCNKVLKNEPASYAER